ncbi:AML1 [Hepatospora eriocheir]|uniref:AML1 n=1 Tax=Hepatospora eriocheir TaxID=1081669 RepID=A0A1X0QEQ9_9MICR|nr:AML1 [Hepatospora eriocheir]
MTKNWINQINQKSTETAYNEFIKNAERDTKPSKEEGKSKAYAFPSYFNFSYTTVDSIKNKTFNSIDSSTTNNIQTGNYICTKTSCQRTDGHISKTVKPFKSISNNVRDEGNHIRVGDNRTTVMIRNIPNKVDLDILIQLINKCVFGRYNFLYLRLDFSNGCNTGYAFINFVSKEDVQTFYKAFQGYKWIDFHHSSKVVQLTYANIQGLEALITKFKESSVMGMPPEYRPRLFYTSGKLIGKTKPNFDLKE